MFTGTILLLGGTGKVAREIAPLLYPTYPVVIASRSGSSSDSAKYTGVKFDWHDESTWDAALSAGPTPVSSVWIVVPGMLEPGPVARKFIGLARQKGAIRFVLLSSSQVEDGGPAMGQIHQYLRELGDKAEAEWAVLRPTWFQENFSDHENHFKSIKEENKIYSATGSGKVPWVSTRDIAAVAHHALTTAEAPNREFLILGGKLYTHKDLAQIFTEVLGREIVYAELSEDELAHRHGKFGMPAQYASILAAMDTIIKHGGEDRLDDTVLTVTGKKPRSFREFVDENKVIWQ
ncbi:agroclavine dehydrogenase [Truncatella angustata]|uniref:Agroclavine dehydrogenase n=1 Tax=Truncatella angustata TaxID=152316 RepID=A0A9P8UT68_9PEZI|nr:agroclavine dehydrogenase [Truncatella angustata]KAH6657721.1 agroclavine dehydrogenase [Truncatella angustata]